MTAGRPSIDIKEQIEACERVAEAMIDRRCGFVRLEGARLTHDALRAAATLRDVQSGKLVPSECEHVWTHGITGPMNWQQCQQCNMVKVL